MIDLEKILKPHGPGRRACDYSGNVLVYRIDLTKKGKRDILGKGHPVRKTFSAYESEDGILLKPSADGFVIARSTGENRGNICIKPFCRYLADKGYKKICTSVSDDGTITITNRKEGVE